MRWSLGLVLLGMSVLPVVAPIQASAESVSTTGQQIKITAVVLPAIYVVVNNQNQIQQIISNTRERDTTPTIYKNVTKLENLQSITPELQSQVTMLLKNADVKPGIIFDQSAIPIQKQVKKVLPFLTVRK